MNAEGDIPSATEIDKSTAPSLLQRIGSMTGAKKRNNKKLENELTEKIEALQLKVSDLTKEVEERKGEIDQNKDEKENWRRESDANKAEFDRYKMESEFQVQLKSTEIDYLKEMQMTCKKSEDELKDQLAEMKSEITAKSEENGSLKLASQDIKKNLESEVQLKSNEIECLKNSHADLKSQFAEMKSDVDNLKDNNKNRELEIQMKLNEIECLKNSEAELTSQLAEMKSDVESKSNEIENLKLLTSQRGKTTRRLESEVQLKSNEIEYLKKSEAEMKNRISHLEGQINSFFVKIDNRKMSHDVRKILERVETTSIDPKSLHNQATEMTIRARFTKISKLTSTRVYSQLMEFAGLDWSIYLKKTDENLAFFVEAQNKNAEKWSCVAFVGLQLISLKDENIVHTINTKKPDVFTDCEGGHRGWGHDKFISFKDLFNEEKGYVKDDSIIVAAVIKAFPNAQ